MLIVISKKTQPSTIYPEPINDQTPIAVMNADMISNEQLNSDRSKLPGNGITNITSASNLLQKLEDYNNVIVSMRISGVLLMYNSCKFCSFCVVEFTLWLWTHGYLDCHRPTAAVNHVSQDQYW